MVFAHITFWACSSRIISLPDTSTPKPGGVPWDRGALVLGSTQGYSGELLLSVKSLHSEISARLVLCLTVLLLLLVPLVIRLVACSGVSRYTVSLVTTSTVPSSHDVAAFSEIGPPLCGLPNDRQVHPPTDYTSFTPPPKGGTYVDPDFGCTVKRVSDAVTDFGPNTGVHHAYSLLSPFNANDTLLSLYVENGPGWYIADMNGSIVVPPAHMVGNKNVQWDASSPYVYWNTSGTRLLQATINYTRRCASAHNCTVNSRVWLDFAENGYTAIENMETGGSPISYDGDHVALAGMKAGSSVFDYYFVWKLSTNTVDYHPSGSGTAVWHPRGVTGMHAFQITGKNSIKVGLTSTNYNHDVIWDGTNAYQFQVNGVHTDFGLDLAGNDVALIGRDADTADPCPNRGGSDVQENWTTTMSFSCWFDNNWRDSHINYQGGPKQPWAVWSAFHDPNYPNIYNLPPESDWQTVWPQWAGEVVVARVDAKNNPAGVYRLAHHRSHPAYLNQFWRQPHASISRSGKYVMFDSDMGNRNSAGGNGYTDAYIIQIH